MSVTQTREARVGHHLIERKAQARRGLQPARFLLQPDRITAADHTALPHRRIDAEIDLVVLRHRA